jgi:hypothetical protein
VPVSRFDEGSKAWIVDEEGPEVACWPTRASSWNHGSSGSSRAVSGRISRRTTTFLEPPLDLVVGFGRLRAHQEPYEAQLRQVLADRAPVHLDLELLLDPRLPVDPAPMHYAIRGHVRPPFEEGGRLLLLVGRQLGGMARDLADR